RCDVDPTDRIEREDHEHYELNDREDGASDRAQRARAGLMSSWRLDRGHCVHRRLARVALRPGFAVLVHEAIAGGTAPKRQLGIHPVDGEVTNRTAEVV